MFIAFQNKHLRNLCEDNDLAIKELGEEVATKLKSRLADINSITYLSDLVAGNLRKIENKSLNYEISLYGKFVMIFVVSHVSTPLDRTGNVDNAKVSRIKILEIKKIK